MIGIGIGANLGDVKSTMDRAIELLSHYVSDITISQYWKTIAFPDPEEPPFLNAVLICNSSLSPEALLNAMQSIEKNLGRKERKKWDSREIDLDILFYHDKIISTDRLSVPHPYMADRDFVLVPLVDIAPNWKHPIFNKTARELLDELPDHAARTILDPLK